VNVALYFQRRFWPRPAAADDSGAVPVAVGDLGCPTVIGRPSSGEGAREE
jgi:hypothetical protein